ncbi:MAG: hypothetical protein NT061_09460 [Spirochaetes bacterium]|nr:hypothetical protein [Spirochaetota bacterium]
MARERWSREELYKLVWERPMTSLANEYHISNVGLRKVCVRYDIPVPQVGHWAKVKTGQKIKRPPLPDKLNDIPILKPEKRPVVQLGQKAISILDEDKKPSFLAALSFKQESANTIKVTVGEEPKHEIAARTLAVLLRPSRKEGIIADLPRKILDVRVTQTTARRSVAIMDVLLDAFEKKRGTSTSCRGDKDRKSEVFDQIP